MLSEEYSRFIESWGSLGVFWGINRSMARIHAFLMLSEQPVDLDTISDTLNISRGNASMSLKELRSWGAIQRVHASGDRRDFYIVEQDAWRMLFKIAKGRKEREFNPALYALRDLMSEADTEQQAQVNARLTQMEEILSTVHAVMNKALESEKSSKRMFDILKNFV
ncbi:ArsR family transcriptional regulator [candidate division KSB1 bacterium]|nr:ArsR family transcriptional regulator [candidate division KSB1 bacterium]